jgi:hypothetical protein
MEVIGHVARRIDVGQGGTAVLVDEHSVVDLRARRREQLGIGLDADARHHEIAREHPALLRAHALHAALALEGGDGILEHQLHALLAVDVGEHRTDLRTEHPGQRHRMSLDGGDLHTHLAERRCHLRADEAQAHYYRTAARSSLGPNPIAILDSAKLEDTGEVTTRSGESPVAPARGHEQAIIGNPLSALERDVLAAGIDRGRAHPEPEVDMPLGVERRRVDQLILEAILAAQVALGERGPTCRASASRPRSW